MASSTTFAWSSSVASSSSIGRSGATVSWPRARRSRSTRCQYHPTSPAPWIRAYVAIGILGPVRRRTLSILQLLPAPSVIGAEQAAQVVDLAGVVEVVADDGRDDPAGRPLLAPIRHAIAVEIAIGQVLDVLPEGPMRLAEPVDRLRHRCRVGLPGALHFRRAPLFRA